MEENRSDNLMNDAQNAAGTPAPTAPAPAAPAPTAPVSEAEAAARAQEAAMRAQAAQAAAEEQARRERDMRAQQAYLAEQARIAEEARRAEAQRRYYEEQRAAEAARRAAEEKAEAKRRRKKGFGIAALVLAVAILAGFGGWAAGSFAGRTREPADASTPEKVLQHVEPTAPTAGPPETIAVGDPSVEVVTPVPSGAAAMLTDVSDIVEKVMPAVVSITNTSTKTQSSFYGSQQYQSVSAGSGIIIGDSGFELWVVTNNHVTEGAEKLEVTFIDGETIEVYVKGTSAENDLAVLGVGLDKLKDSTRAAIRTITMGDSDTLRLGEGVIAIGNAMGWGQSVTTGVVSALKRDVSFNDGTKMTLLQTSAAINPGNSGGALLNSKGELIGINNAKYSDTDVEGVGFAIPISGVREIMEELSLLQPRFPVSEEDFPYIGVTFKEISMTMMIAYGMPEGALVYSVSENTPASEAGLLPWDVITKLNDRKINSYDDLQDELQYYKGGTEITLMLARMEHGSWENVEIKLTLGFKKDVEN